MNALLVTWSAIAALAGAATVGAATYHLVAGDDKTETEAAPTCAVSNIGCFEINPGSCGASVGVFEESMAFVLCQENTVDYLIYCSLENIAVVGKVGCVCVSDEAGQPACPDTLSGNSCVAAAAPAGSFYVGFVCALVPTPPSEVNGATHHRVLG